MARGGAHVELEMAASARASVCCGEQPETMTGPFRVLESVVSGTSSRLRTSSRGRRRTRAARRSEAGAERTSRARIPVSDPRASLLGHRNRWRAGECADAGAFGSIPLVTRSGVGSVAARSCLGLDDAGPACPDQLGVGGAEAVVSGVGIAVTALWMACCALAPVARGARGRPSRTGRRFDLLAVIAMTCGTAWVRFDAYSGPAGLLDNRGRCMRGGSSSACRRGCRGLVAAGRRRGANRSSACDRRQPEARSRRHLVDVARGV